MAMRSVGTDAPEQQQVVDKSASAPASNTIVLETSDYVAAVNKSDNEREDQEIGLGKPEEKNEALSKCTAYVYRSTAGECDESELAQLVARTVMRAHCVKKRICCVPSRA